MAVIFYGTKTFTKFVGYFGEKEECEACHKTYKKAYVRNKVWAHLNDIPLFPMKTFYNKESAEGAKLAKSIQENLNEAIQRENNRYMQ